MRAPRVPSGLPVGLPGVLAVLMATGWAANHFSAVIPTLAEREGLSAALLDGAFGLYAVGLLPGLSGGGALSDRVGRPLVVLPGALVAAVGTVVLLLDHAPAGLLVGRLVVGLGAGLTFGAGTAWAADLAGSTGTVLAGVFLSSGFGVGPLFSGALGEWAPAPLHTPFVLSLVLSVLAVGWAVATSVPATRGVRDAGPRTAAVEPAHDVRTALAWSLPVALLVFATAATALVTVPQRLPPSYAGPLLVGLAATLSLGAGTLLQFLARRGGWGPITGVLGAACGATGFALVAIGGSRIGLPLFVAVCLLMGAAYGLCLREGLLDVESLAPPERRGLLTGVFYVATYVGFGLPLLLEALRPAAGITAPLVVLVAVAAAVALLRVVQLRGGHPGRRAAS